MKSLYQESGKLKADFLPAIYCDSSFLIEYWIAEVFEGHDVFDELGLKKFELPYTDYLIELLKSDVKSKKIFEIREKVLFGSLDIWFVTSPLSSIEMIEWKAESSLKQIIAEKVNAISVQKRGKKEIGDILKKNIR